jgi:polyisoprenoid-binding protein YceI
VTGRLFAAVLCATATCAASFGAAAADYSFDPTHTTVHIELPAVGGLAVIARLAKSEGSLAFDRAARSGRVEISLPAAALDSGVPALDALLRGPLVLDAAAHPTLKFVGEAFRFEGDKLASVAGTLTVKGRDTPLMLTAVRFNCYTSPLFRREVCGGDFEAAIDRAALGLGEGSGLLRVQVEALKL